jgi:hypothetical protein
MIAQAHIDDDGGRVSCSRRMSRNDNSLALGAERFVGAPEVAD